MKRLILIFIIATTTFSAISQKGKRGEVIPQTQEDSLMLESVFIEAEKQLILENYSQALESFMTALEMNSENAVTYFKISEVLSKSNEGRKAVPYGLKAIALDPENKYYRLSLARIYNSVGFYIEAAKTYEEMLAKFPTDENALYELAELYQLTGRRDEVFETFDKIEAYHGVNEEIIRERQRIFIKEGNLDGVVQEYNKLIDAYPNELAYRIEFISFLIQNRKLDDAENEIITYEAGKSSSSRFLLLKSELAWMRGETSQALDFLRQVFVSNTVDFDTKFHFISNYMMKLGKEDEPQPFIDLAVLLADLYPDEFRAQALAGDVLYQNGMVREALTHYLSAVDQNPSNFSVWQNILNVEMDLAMYDSVVVHAEEALEYFPNQSLLYYFAGTGYLIDNDYQRAVRMLDQGSKYTIDPTLLSLFYGQLGDAYYSLSDTEMSFKSYEKALKNSPENDHVLNNYSYYLSLNKQNLEKALQMSTKLVGLHPTNATYLDTHGWVLYTAGDFKESKKYLEKAASLGSDGTVVEHYGDVLYQLGDINEAVKQWERARELGGTSELIEKKIKDRRLYE